MAHICHINTTFNCKAGSTRRTYIVAKGLTRLGHKVTLIVGRVFTPDVDWDLRDLNVIQIPRLVKYIEPLNDVRAFLEIHRCVRNIAPDLVHTHLAKAGILGRLAAHKAGVKRIVHTVHGPSFPDSLPAYRREAFKSLERICAKYTEAFVFVGEGVRKQYVKANVCKLENSYTIRTAFDDRMPEGCSKTTAKEVIRTELGIVESECPQFIVAYVGRIVSSKCHEDAILAAGELRSKGIEAHLLLVGEALLDEEKAHEESLRALVGCNSLTKMVHFLGFRKDVMRIIAASDVVVLTSKYEGLPNVAVEAALAGRPIVSYNVCGIDEVVRNGVTGYIVPQGDRTRLVDRLERLARDAILRNKMGEEARAYSINRYSQRTMVNDTMNLYARLLGNRWSSGVPRD